MSGISIQYVGNAELTRVNKVLAGIPGGAWKATFPALKRAGDTAKTKAGQFAAAEYTISKGTFMRNVHMKSRLFGDSEGVATMYISFAGRVLPLRYFNTRYGKNGLVSTQVKRNGGGATLHHVFVASVLGQTGFFERLGTSRLPVEQKYGPSVGQMMHNETIMEQMSQTVSDTFEKRIEHEISRVLNGWGG